METNKVVYLKDCKKTPVWGNSIIEMFDTQEYIRKQLSASLRHTLPADTRTATEVFMLINTPRQLLKD